MSEERELTISQETFLKALGVNRVESSIHSEVAMRKLYELTSEYLIATGAAKPVDEARGRTTELPLKLPGLPIHVRLSAPSKEELTDFINAGMIILAVARGDIQAVTGVTIGAVMSLMTRTQLLRAKYGEVCLVEAVAECKRPTQGNVCQVLYGNPCRRPNIGCQFHEEKTSKCLFELAKVKSTLQDLEQKKIIKRLNAVNPAEYGVVF